MRRSILFAAALVLLLAVPGGGLAAKKKPKPKTKRKPSPAAVAPKPKRNGKIAFVSDADGTRQIFVVAADGSGRRQLTQSSEDAYEESYSPAWSPSGASIAYVHADEEGTSGIWTMRADGTNQQALIPDGAAPAWSPDGKWIAYLKADGDSGNDALWVAASDGRSPRRLCWSDEASLAAPAWAADGKQILYSRDGMLFAASFGGSVRCQAASLGAGDEPSVAWNAALLFDRTDDSGNRRLLARPKGGAPAELTSGEADDSNPAWSPDGKRIVFVSDRDGNAEIYVARADGSGAVNVTNDPVDDPAADCDPDVDDTCLDDASAAAQDGEPAWQPLP